MARFRFIHASDLHLDTPFERIARLGPDVPEALRDATLLAWDRLVQETIRAKAAFLLIAGDIYDGTERGIRAQGRFLQGLQKLSTAGIQVFIVHGNHDPVEEGWTAIDHWPPGVTVFGAEQVQALPVAQDGKTIATIHGISYGKRETTANLAHHFKPGKATGIKIGLLHCNVGNNEDHPPYSPCSLADLRAAKMDYWALGHVHRHQVLKDGKPWVVYPGSLQGRGHLPGEHGPKGAVMVEVDDDHVSQVDFVPLDVVRFEECTIDTDKVSESPEVLAALASAVQALQKEAEGRTLVLQARLTGSGGMLAPFGNRKAIDALLGELRQSVQAAESMVYWDSVIDERVPKVNLKAIAKRGDFSAEVLVLAKKLEKDDQALEIFLQTHCELSMADQFHDLPPLPEGEAAKKLLREALATGLEALDVEPQS